MAYKYTDNREKTVRMVVVEKHRGIDEVLLVRKKVKGGRPANWSIPGGGQPSKDSECVIFYLLDLRRKDQNLEESDDPVIQYLLSQIANFLPYCLTEYRGLTEKIIKSKFTSEVLNRKSEVLEKDPLAFLTAIKEGLEETGLLLFPQKVLKWVRREGDSPVLLVSAVKLSGEIGGLVVESFELRWFPLSDLPKNIHSSHAVWLQNVLKSDGIRVLVGLSSNEETNKDEHSKKIKELA